MQEPQWCQSVGDLRIDSRAFSVTYRGRPISLTPAEFRILELLSSHEGWVYSAGQLAECCLKEHGSADSITVHISNLRQKLKAVGARPQVENVRGFGYRVQCSLESPSASRH